MTASVSVTLDDAPGRVSVAASADVMVWVALVLLTDRIVPMAVAGYRGVKC
jgi:hypothetical protein